MDDSDQPLTRREARAREAQQRLDAERAASDGAAGEPTQAMDAVDLPAGQAPAAPTPAAPAASTSAGLPGPQPAASAISSAPAPSAFGSTSPGETGATRGDGQASSGAMTALGRRKTAWLIAAACAAFVLLGGGAVAAGSAVGSAAAAPVPGPTRTHTSTPTPTPRPVPATPAAATSIRTCTVGELATDKRLGDMEAQVRNAKTGAVLFSRNGDEPHATASVMKIVTSAAALAALGGDYRLTTTVVAGPEPGSVILVGGGDSTLSRLPDGVQPYYGRAGKTAHIADLAKDTVDAMDGTPITKVYVDTSLYGKPYWQPTWNEHEERFVDGSSSYVTALQVDGDRANPQATDSQRSDDPVTVAVNAFIKALDDNGENVPTVQKADGIEKKADTDATTLATAKSQPISKLITLALTDSDNTIMETLARQVAIKEGTGNTFKAENAGVLKALSTYDISTKGLHIADGSGLSDDNRVPPSYLTQLLVKVKNDKALKPIDDGLPVAGKSGTLGPGFGRFTGSSAVAQGHVRAKTGSVDDGYSLSGLIDAKDGSTLTFAIYAFGKVNDSARTAIDALTTGFYTCGANLSDR